MKRGSIGRLRRLIRLSECLYEQETRDAKAVIQARDEAVMMAETTRGYLERDTLVGNAFPELVRARTLKLQKHAGELREKADDQVAAVAAARGRVKGLEARLHMQITVEERECNASTLDETIDQYVRRGLTSLP
jgi:hypothetical protein